MAICSSLDCYAKLGIENEGVGIQITAFLTNITDAGC